MKINLIQYVLTVTNLFEYKTLYKKSLIFFVLLRYSVFFSVVDVITSKRYFFLKQINSEGLFWTNVFIHNFKLISNLRNKYTINVWFVCRLCHVLCHFRRCCT